MIIYVILYNYNGTYGTRINWKTHQVRAVRTLFNLTSLPFQIDEYETKNRRGESFNQKE